MRHLRALFMSLIVAAAAAAASTAVAAAAPITNASLIKFCVRIDGGDSDRGTVRIINVGPTNLSWKDGKAPKACKDNEQQLDWSGGSGTTGATGPAGATGASGTNGTNGVD